MLHENKLFLPTIAENVELLCTSLSDPVAGRIIKNLVELEDGTENPGLRLLGNIVLWRYLHGDGERYGWAVERSADRLTFHFAVSFDGEGKPRRYNFTVGIEEDEIARPEPNAKPDILMLHFIIQMEIPLSAQESITYDLFDWDLYFSDKSKELSPVWKFDKQSRSFQFIGLIIPSSRATRYQRLEYMLNSAIGSSA